MEYQLTAELVSPPGAPDLDPLQQVGVMSLLDERLNHLVSIEGPDDVEIIPVEHSLEAHLGGAVVSWLLDAPALALAEEAARAVLEQIIDEIDLLEDWEVKHCAVTATDDQLESALAVSMDPDELGGQLLGLDSSADMRTFLLDAEDTDEIQAAVRKAELADRRARLLRLGEQLRAFDLSAFGESDGVKARYLAGALLYGVEMLIDELFGDAQLLDDEDATVEELEALWALDELPPQYADRYDALFARRFLVTASVLGHRLTQEHWNGPLCVAEALALRIAESRAEVELDLIEVLEVDHGNGIFSVFNEHALNDLDSDSLYEVSESELDAELSFDNWFRPRGASGENPASHPYLTDGT